MDQDMDQDAEAVVAGIERLVAGFPPAPPVTLGRVTVRVEDQDGVREVISQPATATESAGADTQGIVA